MVTNLLHIRILPCHHVALFRSAKTKESPGMPDRGGRGPPIDESQNPGKVPRLQIRLPASYILTVLG